MSTLSGQDQREFYQFLEKEIIRQNYIDVQGQISYLFVYVYKILGKRRNIGYTNTYDELMNIAEAYYREEKFFKLCKFWAADCLLANNEYRIYLEQTEPETPIGREKFVSNLRLNIQMICELPINGVDLFKMASGNVSKPTRKYLGLFKDLLVNAPEKYLIDFGDWLENAKNDLKRKEEFRYKLFSSSMLMHPHKELTLYFFDESSNLKEKVVSLARTVENNLRESVGLPRIGEGWVSETELFYFLKNRFSQTNVVQHGKPEWLRKQHFDIWFPRWKIAVEYHGMQHFEPVDFFGGETSFEETQKRDERKKYLAKSHGVKLFVVRENESYDDVAMQIEAHVEKLSQKLSSENTQNNQ